MRLAFETYVIKCHSLESLVSPRLTPVTLLPNQNLPFIRSAEVSWNQVSSASGSSASRVRYL